MANKEHLEILEQGIEAWNEWRRRNPKVLPDLSEAKFNYSDLRNANLSNANLRNAIFYKANLSKANLSKADLYEALFYRANLNNANLCEALLMSALLGFSNLSNTSLVMAHLSDADLSYAKLINANLSNADLNNVNLSYADLTNANLSDALLKCAILTNTNFDKANLTNCLIYGIAVWDVKLNETIQKDLIITPEGAPTITVDNLEVAQFIYLLLHNEKIRHIIDTITTKVVLILGRFTPKRKIILEAIRKELRKHDYVPVLFDFDKPARRDTQETITMLARMAKFVIADITSPKSIPQELKSIVETLPSVPIKPLLMKGRRPWGMFDHIKRYPWVLAVHHYRDLDDLKATLIEKVIAPAEAKVIEIRNK